MSVKTLLPSLHDIQLIIIIMLCGFAAGVDGGCCGISQRIHGLGVGGVLTIITVLHSHYSI